MQPSIWSSMSWNSHIDMAICYLQGFPHDFCMALVCTCPKTNKHVPNAERNHAKCSAAISHEVMILSLDFRPIVVSSSRSQGSPPFSYFSGPDSSWTSNIFSFSIIYGMSSFPLTFIFFKMVIAPPTRYCMSDNLVNESVPFYINFSAWGVKAVIPWWKMATQLVQLGRWILPVIQILPTLWLFNIAMV